MFAVSIALLILAACISVLFMVKERLDNTRLANQHNQYLLWLERNNIPVTFTKNYRENPTSRPYNYETDGL